MSERTGYQHGDPSWADHASDDPAGAASFYSQLFGWQTENRMPAEMEGEYHMAELDGKAVAACGSQPQEGVPATWNTYVTVDSADRTAEAVTAAGGTVMMEPFDVLAAGRMAVHADPTGAIFMSWEPKDMIGAERVNEPGAMGWNELATRDREASKGFYGSVFGWTTSTMDFEGGQYTMWHHPEDETQGIGGMLEMAGDQWPADMPPHWMVYFVVEDPNAAAQMCEQLGGKVAVPPFDTPAGPMAVLSDPQGAVFSVINPAAQQP